jgi:single-strand DNA-binding protein
MIIGRLGRDPEMRYTPSGRPVTTFSVATSRSWNTSEGGRRTETEWFNVVAWSTLAEICKQHLSKGRLVYIEGRLQTRQWDDPEGAKHSSTEIVANEMIMLDERREGAQVEDEIDVDEEEFPF